MAEHDDRAPGSGNFPAGLPTDGPRVVLRLPARVAVARSDGRDLFLVEGERRFPLGPATPELVGLLKLLRDGVVGAADTADAVEAVVPESAGTVARLRETGWLATVVGRDGDDLAEIRVFGGPPPPGNPRPDLGRPLALSRFALLRRDGDGLLLESAVAAAEARLTGSIAAALVLDLAQPAALDVLAAGSDARAALIRALADAGFVVNVPGPEDEQFRLRQWSPHEALFHGRSRWGALNGTAPVGPSTWASGSGPLPSARRAPDDPPRRRIMLAAPGVLPVADSSGAAGSGSSDFFAVLERRKSLRFQDEASPLDVASLGEFLFRSARVRSEFAYEGVEYTDRPYPSGGGAHELEIYIAAREVTGLAPGFYRYDPFEHALDMVDASPATAAAFAASAARATTLPVPPQAVVVIAARFGRLLGRYRAMGYATVLKNVGVLYQTMYLTATALGLAPCGLGNGDVDLFEAAAGVDRWEESSVGEFALGSRAV